MIKKYFILRKWANDESKTLINAICSDIHTHFQKITKGNEKISGYAVLPGDISTMPDPASLSSAYVSSSSKLRGAMKYNPNEWGCLSGDAYKNSKGELKLIYNEVMAMQPNRKTDDFSLNMYDRAFDYKITVSTLTALKKLKSNGVISDDVFLVIWYSDSDHPIIKRSVKSLNSEKTYRDFVNLM